MPKSKTSSWMDTNSGLVIGRQAGESIIIGDDIRITVLRYEGGLTRLRVEAPKDVRILREEIYDEQKDLFIGTSS